MNLPPNFQIGCLRPVFLTQPASCRSLSRVVRSRRPALRTFVVVVTCDGLPFDHENVTTCILPACREEDIETQHWSRDDGREDERPYRTANELHAAGFRFVRREAARELVVVCPTCRNHFTTTANLRFEWWQEFAIVTPTWPSDEDERRLNEIAEQLVERLLFKLTHPPGTPYPKQQRPLAD